MFLHQYSQDHAWRYLPSQLDVIRLKELWNLQTNANYLIKCSKKFIIDHRRRTLTDRTLTTLTGDLKVLGLNLLNYSLALYSHLLFDSRIDPIEIFADARRGHWVLQVAVTRDCGEPRHDPGQVLGRRVSLSGGAVQRSTGVALHGIRWHERQSWHIMSTSD